MELWSNLRFEKEIPAFFKGAHIVGIRELQWVLIIT